MTTTVDWGPHERQDARSLAFHRAAVEALRRAPELSSKALEVLDRWESASSIDSKPLRDEWRRIIQARLWERAIEPSERGNQLRQASPLVFVLEKPVRDEIRERFDLPAIRKTDA
jgi:hypothetical protein